MPRAVQTDEIACAHCGDRCPDRSVAIDEQYFCCTGCKAVWELLHDSDLDTYYHLEDRPGISLKSAKFGEKFAYLDDDTVRAKILEFDDGRTARVTFTIPQMHCSSCIWLLENLYRLRKGISESTVNFLRKELSVTFDPREISLRQLVEQLATIGYEPNLTLETVERGGAKSSNKRLYTQIGIAGFAFANIMLFSFPDYLALETIVDESFRRFFGYLSIGLALPVLFYSAADYFQSAYRALRQKQINMDLPISLGIVALFVRSVYEIVFGVGTGYMDSFTGLVLFLLVGKLYQQKTYDAMRFDRDYRSYFPLSITVKRTGGETTVPISALKVGERVVIRNGELIPADSKLLGGSAMIDYSFVTGEAEPVERAPGDVVYAGGRQVGAAIELEVTKEVSQSYLTRLWNHEAFSTPKAVSITTLANRISKYFTAAVIGLATIAAVYWYIQDASRALDAFTAVLIVACPCALALSSPFTLGTALRILSRRQLHIRNADTIEQLADIDTIVFDKTGTLTRPGGTTVSYEGDELADRERALLAAAVRQSTHAVSRKIGEWLGGIEAADVGLFEEHPGKGLIAQVDGHTVVLGSPKFVREHVGRVESKFSVDATWLAIDGRLRGAFTLTHAYREGMQPVIERLKQDYELAVLSGDHDSERPLLQKTFGGDTEMRFRQAPQDKLTFIDKLRHDGAKVLMIGDGLNDAGALRLADVGIAVSEDSAAFSPASDAILSGEQFGELPKYLKLAKRAITIILISFGISFLYNAVGLGFAMSGRLAPLVAAVLMPLSSISVVLFATLTTRFVARKIGLR